MKLSVSNLNMVAQVALVLGAVCSIIFDVSRRAGDFVMGGLNILLAMAFLDRGTCKTTRLGETIIQQVPKKIETATGKFNLKGRLVYYAVCTTCNCTHKPIFKRGQAHATYPKYCNNIPSPGEGKCGTVLLEPRSVGGLNIWRPRLMCAYHELNDYICGLECREDLREHLDSACDKAMAEFSKGVPNDFSDVFSGDFVRSFKWVDDKLFIDRPKGEGRLLFSLNLDFFNVEEMRLRGASASSGIVAMACLNLPVDIRYKPENMYISCIIPGPKEPRLTQTNHFLRPLVEDLKVSWERGTQFSHSPDRVVRSALACAVCDLVGARKLSCMAGVTSNHICTICDCFGHASYGRTDVDEWKTRNREDLLDAATHWRNATSANEQDKLFSANGIRWSELWRLPYWDRARQLVIDPMHNLLEGLAQAHFRFVLGLTTIEAKTIPPPLPAFEFQFPPLPDRAHVPLHPIFVKDSGSFLNDKEIHQVSQIYSILQAQITDEDGLQSVGKKLGSKNRSALEYACRCLGLTPSEAAAAMRRGKKSKAFWIEMLFHFY